jgi:peptide/nickel transport system substrate-binding protein
MCRVLPVLVLALLLAGCGIEIEGGVEPPTTPGTLPQPADPTPTPSPAAAASPQDTATAPRTENRGTAFQIGLIDEPGDLLPYHASPADERITAPVTELLFPSPLLASSYTYTMTGVLERMPSFANGDIELRLIEVYLDETGAITDTITDVLTDAQQLVITYRWNPDLHWSDGEPVTAEDSLFAYELAQATPLGEDAAERLQFTERYEMVDTYTTRAFLKPDLPDVNRGATESPASLDLRTMEYMLAFWTPLPRHLLEFEPVDAVTTGEFAAQPLSYGPYRVASRGDQRIRLERNPYYTANTLPEADVVSFLFLPDTEALADALLNGSIDIAVTDEVSPDQIAAFQQQQQQGTLDAEFVPNPVWEHLDFNMRFGTLRDIRVRRAIAHGTNREAMTEALFGGHVPVLHSWILPEHWAAAPPDTLMQYSYNPDQARALLDEAGIVDMDGDGIREQGIDHDSDGVRESSSAITMTLLTSAETPLRTEIARRFYQDMADIGLTVSILPTGREELYSLDGPLFRRQFELAQFAWIARPDPRGFELWGCSAIPSAANNWSGGNVPGWCLREANQNIITATTSLRRDRRQDAYLRHQQLFAEDLPVLPLFQHLTVVLRNPNVQGLRPDPIAPITWNIAQWTRE